MLVAKLGLEHYKNVSIPIYVKIVSDMISFQRPKLEVAKLCICIKYNFIYNPNILLSNRYIPVFSGHLQFQTILRDLDFQGGC